VLDRVPADDARPQLGSVLRQQFRTLAGGGRIG
jgi:hypothetical protein